MIRILENEMIKSFELAVFSKICGQVRKLKERYGENWEVFVQALKIEFFMKDLKKVTKRTFLERVARPNKDLLLKILLRELEYQYV